MNYKKNIFLWFVMIIITATNVIVCYRTFNEADYTEHGETARDIEPQKIEDHSVESAPFDESENSSTEFGKADEDLREQLIKEGYLVESSWITMAENLSLPYADAEAFQFIRNVYAEIEYGGDLTSGDAAFYEEYIKIFKNLMYNRVPFIDQETGQKIYLKDFDGLKYNYWEMNYYVYAYTYLFYDADGDGYPELSIRNNPRHKEKYIFKYIPEDETFILWYTMGNGYYEITGPKKIQWLGNGGQHLAFYQLNGDGETECYTFFTNGNYNSEVGPYLVMLPIYADRELETVVPEEIKRQGIYEITDKQWYFRVTREQYDELTAPYMEANHRANEAIKQVTYTYEELFGD